MSTGLQKSIVVIGILVAPCLAFAQNAAALPLWEIGALGFGVTQPAYPGASEHVNRALALPFLIYRGNYLRAERGSAAIRAIKSADIEIDVGFAGAFGSHSKDVQARHGMPDLGTMLEFGPRLKWNLGAGPGNGRFQAKFALRGVFDLSDSMAHKGMTFQPEISYERRAAGIWHYKTSVAAVWGDQRMAETFYGVAPLFATPTRSAYNANGGLIAWRLAASFSHQLSPKLQLLGFTHIDSVTRAANASSPLVQSKIGTSAGLGLSYTWQRSDAMAAD